MNPKIGIIIVTYNGSKYINSCLASVFDNGYAGDVAVFVVDNASYDNTVKLIKDNFPQVGIKKLEKNVGFAAGNNIGIKQALGVGCDYIILLNQDTEVDANWLENIIKTAQEEKDAAIFQAMLVLASDKTKLNNLGNALHFLGFGFVKNYQDDFSKYKYSRPLEIGYASGAAMLIKKEVLEKIGLLDEKFFMYMEDMDLSWRARMLRYKIILAPGAVVYHHYEFNKDKKNFFYWNERNRWAVLLQNYSWRTLIILAPALFAVEIAMLFYSLIGNWFAQKIKSYFWILKNLGKVIQTRRSVQLTRKVSDREIVKKMDWQLKMPGNKNFILEYIISPVLFVYYKIVLMLI